MNEPSGTSWGGDRDRLTSDELNQIKCPLAVDADRVMSRLFESREDTAGLREIVLFGGDRFIVLDDLDKRRGAWVMEQSSSPVYTRVYDGNEALAHGNRPDREISLLRR